MSDDMTLLLIGAGIGLVVSIIAAIVQHFLSLRVDRIRRERDSEEEVRKMLREDISGKKCVELTAKSIRDLAALNRLLATGEFYYGSDRYFSTTLTEAETEARIESVARKVLFDEYLQAWSLLNELGKFKILLEENTRD